MRRVLMMALAGTATALATPALADQPAPVDGANCNIVTPTPDAVACSGYWDQNLIAGDALDLTTQHDALAAIGANVPADINDGTRVGPVFDWNTSTFASLPTGTLSSGLLTFGQLLSGITYVGIHFGGANTGLDERTVFYEFDFGSSSVAGITLGEPGFSNAVLYTTTPVRGVPEPATWAMMLLGFGGIGMAMRRGRKQGGRLLQIA
jgi:hypothetical protein